MNKFKVLRNEIDSYVQTKAHAAYGLSVQESNSQSSSCVHMVQCGYTLMSLYLPGMMTRPSSSCYNLRVLNTVMTKIIICDDDDNAKIN